MGHGSKEESLLSYAIETNKVQVIKPNSNNK